MRRGKRPKKKQVHPKRPVSLPGHAYRIFGQRRVWVRRGAEKFLVAAGQPFYFLGLYATRNAARARIMEMVHEADWEHRNPHGPIEFYWVKRVELARGLATTD